MEIRRALLTAGPLMCTIVSSRCADLRVLVVWQFGREQCSAVDDAEPVCQGSTGEARGKRSTFTPHPFALSYVAYRHGGMTARRQSQTLCLQSLTSFYATRPAGKNGLPVLFQEPLHLHRQWALQAERLAGDGMREAEQVDVESESSIGPAGIGRGSGRAHVRRYLCHEPRANRGAGA